MQRVARVVALPVYSHAVTPWVGVIALEDLTHELLRRGHSFQHAAWIGKSVEANLHNLTVREGREEKEKRRGERERSLYLCA